MVWYFLSIFYLWYFLLFTVGIAFDKVEKWSFDDGFGQSVVIFSVDISSSVHSDNYKCNIVVLGERPTGHVIDSAGTTEKVLLNQIQNFVSGSQNWQKMKNG